MAVKVTVRSGERRLLPTVEEVGVKLSDELSGYVRNYHVEIKGDIETYGHVLLNKGPAEKLIMPNPAAETPSPGSTGIAADAGHVHRLPTLAELKAAPDTHTVVEATPEVLGHVRLVTDLSSSDPLAAIQVKSVNDKITEIKSDLDAKIIALQGGIQFYGSYYFARSTPTTDITLPANSPQELSKAAGLIKDTETADPSKIVTLFDFTKNAFCYYAASVTATSWGEPHSILEEGKTHPNNGTQIGITCFFIDIAQNTSALKLAGHANYSEKNNSWDIYPDKVSSIDGDTLDTNDRGQRRVAPYKVSDRSPDNLDFEDVVQDGVTRTFHQWLDAFYRKIRGLRLGLNAQVTKEANDKQELLDKFGEGASDYCIFEEQEITEADWAADAVIA